MQGLLELGKQLYEIEQKKYQIWDQAYEYINSMNDSCLQSIDDQVRKDWYLTNLLYDWEVEEKLKNDSQFLYLKKEYQKYDKIRDSLIEKISNYKICSLEIGKWTLYQFSEPYSNSEVEGLVEEYNVKLKNWEAFTIFFYSFGYQYSKIKVLSKKQEKELGKPIYIEKRGIIRRYK